MEAGRIYHIYNRGNNRETIFKEERNYQFFLDRFKYYLGDWVEVHAYCLMPNHFHFLIRVKELSDEEQAQLQQRFKNFFISYAKAINKSYNRTGSLFQYKFKRKAIETEPQYALNIAYIHYNPVKAGLCTCCEDWKYSSYAVFLSNRSTLVQRASVLKWFGDKNDFLEYHTRYWEQKMENKLSLDLAQDF